MYSVQPDLPIHLPFIELQRSYLTGSLSLSKGSPHHRLAHWAERRSLGSKRMLLLILRSPWQCWPICVCSSQLSSAGSSPAQISVHKRYLTVCTRISMHKIVDFILSTLLQQDCEKVRRATKTPFHNESYFEQTFNQILIKSLPQCPTKRRVQRGVYYSSEQCDILVLQLLKS